MCMKTRWRIPVCLLLCGLLFWFLADAADVRTSMEEALSLCARSVIPSLFPFMVVSSLLLSLGFGEWLSPWFAGWFDPLFRINGAGSSAFLLGLIGGYPIGAKTAAELYQEHLVTREEAERLLAFCNNSNPVFLISVLGVGIFGSVRTGIWLWLIHLGSALLTGLLFRSRGGRPSTRQRLPTPPAFHTVKLSSAFVSAVKSSLSGILSVCAFVIFFYTLAHPMAHLGRYAGPLLVGLTELFSLTPLLESTRFGFIAAAGITGWGGLSVLCQTAAVLDGSGLSPRICFWGKAVQGLLSAALAALLATYILG
jgi:sporulation integral membrane protein YlbJ